LFRSRFQVGSLVGGRLCYTEAGRRMTLHKVGAEKPISAPQLRNSFQAQAAHAAACSFAYNWIYTVARTLIIHGNSRCSQLRVCYEAEDSPCLTSALYHQFFDSSEHRDSYIADHLKAVSSEQSIAGKVEACLKQVLFHYSYCLSVCGSSASFIW
jgi:hypothetical protein